MCGCRRMPSETWVNTAYPVIGLGSVNALLFAVTLSGFVLIFRGFRNNENVTFLTKVQTSCFASVGQNVKTKNSHQPESKRTKHANGAECVWMTGPSGCCTLILSVCRLWRSCPSTVLTHVCRI